MIFKIFHVFGNTSLALVNSIETFLEYFVVNLVSFRVNISYNSAFRLCLDQNTRLRSFTYLYFQLVTPSAKILQFFCFSASNFQGIVYSKAEMLIRVRLRCCYFVRNGVWFDWLDLDCIRRLIKS